NTTYTKRADAGTEQLSDYVGVGIVLAPTGEHTPPVVREVTPGSPAEVAGLKIGDVVAAIGGRSTQGLTLSESVDAIRGADGTEVAMTVRAPDGSTRETTVRRGVVRSNTVNVDTRNGVTYVRMRGMQEGAAAAVRQALVQSAAGTRGWVLDLRGNDRGSLQ